MFTYPFTRDLNITSLRRRTLERLFVNSDPGDVHSGQETNIKLFL